MYTRVDKLEYLVLVDNNIDRLSRLPAGFTSEVVQHAPTAPRDELTGLPVMQFEDYCCGAHGLSILITTTIGDQTHRILFDTGPEGLSIERNVECMNVDLTTLDGLVLSHWHRDHSGGILKTLKLRNAQSPGISPLLVDLHPDRPIRRGLAPPPQYVVRANFLADPTFEEITALNGRVETHAEPHELGQSGVHVSGEIPRVHPFEKGLKGAVTWMEEDGVGDWCTDELIKDERYLAIDVKGKGLVIFSACSHAGICNVITDAAERFDRPVYMVVGGLHLIPVEVQPVKETVDFLSKHRPEWIVPLHCTGFEPRAKLIEEFGNRCVASGVGIKVVIEGDEAADVAMDEASV